MSHRPDQVAKELHKHLGLIIGELIISDRYGLITVSDVTVSAGLENAKIFISSFHHNRDLVKLLNSKAKKIKESLHKKVNLRKIPQLIFIIDDSSDRVTKLEEFFE